MRATWKTVKGLFQACSQVSSRRPAAVSILSVFVFGASLCGLGLQRVEAQLAEGHYVVLDPPIVYPGAIVRFSAAAPKNVKTGLVRVGDREFGGELQDGVVTIYFAMDVETVPGPHRLQYELGERSGSLTVTVRARKFETEVLGEEPLAPGLSDDALDRAETDRARLDRIWTRVTEERLWQGAFALPVEGQLGAPFGLRRVVEGRRRSPHSGMDITAALGSEVKATNFGKVVIAEDQLFFGKVVVLDHGWGLMSVYAHLSESFVVPGQHVATGTILGHVGASGRATAPHLHFGLRLMGARVDPITLPGVEFGSILAEIVARDAVLRQCDIEDACDEEGNLIVDPESPSAGRTGSGPRGSSGVAVYGMGGVPLGEGPRDAEGRGLSEQGKGKDSSSASPAPAAGLRTLKASRRLHSYE